MSFTRTAAVLLLLTACRPALASVVINEVFYHAPEDLDAVQFVELHNPTDKAIDLSGWKLARGAKFVFPAKTAIDAGGYLVVCKDLKAFKKHYGFDAAGPFEGSLSHGKDRIDLFDAKGKKIDAVRYGSRDPWPSAADGCSSSLERICPTAPGDDPSNWAPSPLAKGTPKPGGTPGEKNANYSLRLPPAIANVKFTPASAGPDQEIKVEADVRSAEKLNAIELIYRVAGPGYEKEEKAVRMTKGDKDRYSGSIPAQKAGQIVRFRIHAVDAKRTRRFFPHDNDVRPALSVYVHEQFSPGKIPFGLVINVGEKEFKAAQRPVGGGFRFATAPSAAPPARGNSAFVYVDQKTGKPELFDFINVTPRSSGRKVRFHKDHTLDGMRTINLIYEPHDRFVLAEPMAFAVYHKAGLGACKTDFVRTWIDGRPIGYQLLVEQPNKSFLKRNDLRTDGNLYKAQWMGWDVTRRHEKKTNVHTGHDDVVKLVAELGKVKGDKQWAVIKKEFDVEQVATYYAVRMILSDWDGFFNNYFAYHDVHGSGKWTMYPWDQDKTWGYHDGIRGDEVFFDMPLTFGMEGDKAPKLKKGEFDFGFGGPPWWRTGGDFSRPLLANPTFRKLFLAKTKELLETTYTEKMIFPLLKALGERLEDEVKVRAELYRGDPKEAQQRLSKNLDVLREHLKKRRAFLLEQDEIKNAGKFDRALLK